MKYSNQALFAILAIVILGVFSAAHASVTSSVDFSDPLDLNFNTHLDQTVDPAVNTHALGQRSRKNSTQSSFAGRNNSIFDESSGGLVVGSSGRRVGASVNPSYSTAQVTVMTSEQNSDPPIATPVPSAVWLLGSGLLALLGVGRVARRD